MSNIGVHMPCLFRESSVCCVFICTPWVKKRCHSNHGYNFVNSWSICKILSVLQRAFNLQQNSH